MFAYCRNNPVIRRDITGTHDKQDLDCTPNLDEDKLDGKSSTGSGTQNIAASPGGSSAGGNGSTVGSTGSGGSSTGSFSVSVGSSGIAAAPNPNNEKTERHHIVEQCQVRKSGFSQVDIQGNSNLIDLPYSHHRKISGHYSSIQDFTGGKRVRDWLAGQSFETQTQYGIDAINRIWGDLYGD